VLAKILSTKTGENCLEGAKAAGADATYLISVICPYRSMMGFEEAEGLPECPQAQAPMKAHQGFLIACPEYNSSITPLLKNAIDWASRPEPGEPSLVCFKEKVAVLMSASWNFWRLTRINSCPFHSWQH